MSRWTSSQTNYVGKGADVSGNTWYIDGIPSTDMTALGRRRPITTSTCSRRTLDIRAEKAFTFGDRRLIFDVDVFNLFNSATVLGRQYDVQATGDTGFNRVLEIMTPRIVRLVVRVQF